jgi:hypothetical protein
MVVEVRRQLPPGVRQGGLFVVAMAMGAGVTLLFSIARITDDGLSRSALAPQPPVSVIAHLRQSVLAKPATEVALPTAPVYGTATPGDRVISVTGAGFALVKLAQHVRQPPAPSGDGGVSSPSEPAPGGTVDSGGNASPPPGRLFTRGGVSNKERTQGDVRQGQGRARQTVHASRSNIVAQTNGGGSAKGSAKAHKQKAKPAKTTGGAAAKEAGKPADAQRSKGKRGDVATAALVSARADTNSVVTMSASRSSGTARTR